MSIVKKPAEILDLSKEEMDSIGNILSETSEDHLTLLLAELLKAEIDIRNASSPRLAFEMSLLKVSFLTGLKPVKEIIEHIEEYIKSAPGTGYATGKTQKDEKNKEKETSLEMTSAETELPDEGTDVGSLSEEVEEGPEPPVSEEISIIDDVWDRAIKKMDPPLASKLSKASFGLSGNKLVLTLNGGYSVFTDSIKKNAGRIEQIFSEELGNKVRLEVEAVNKKAVRKKDLKEEVLAEPAIQEVLGLFDGSRVVDVIPVTEKKE